MDIQTDPHPNFWTYTKADALSKLATAEVGLSDQEAAKRLKAYGTNTINPATGNKGILLFLSQFKSPITIMLAQCGGI
ncbi:cation-transporting P-type ATPase [Mucilaginibacter lappiensis]|uniref:Mg2+-importing ATPase n=1 Tax=Mucilaginibacter lappiensis TaxID=354630 RepID=A0A841JS65_9SPHI|nr:cation-transporting P-type ATPase [Mucilaginibacter lappiensis]MBB6130691.1 Mg2+-importing ATPase [Mucilaginibacter lappiensis]